MFRRVNPAPERRVTTFFITVNTQKEFVRPEDLGQAETELIDILDNVYANFNEVLEIYVPDIERPELNRKDKYKLKNMVQLEVPPENLAREIHNPTYEISTEVGTKIHRLHSHSTLSFEADPLFRFTVNLVALRSLLPEGFYVNVRYLPDHAANAREYAKKNVTQ